jgi:hypothetical protein
VLKLKFKDIKNSFTEYLSGINKIFARSLLIVFTIGGIAILGVAIMLIADVTNGINVIEAEVIPIILYIFRSICLAEFFLLLFDYAARKV